MRLTSHIRKYAFISSLIMMLFLVIPVPLMAQEELGDFLSGDLFISSPANGQVFVPGSNIQVEITVEASANFDAIGLVAETLGSVPPLKAPPFVFDLPTPDTFIGPMELRATGLTEFEAFFSEAIEIILEPSTSAQQLLADPTDINFLYTGDEEDLIISAIFENDLFLDVSRSNQLTVVSENPNVALVNSLGIVIAVGAGQTNIVANFQGLSVEIPVFVPDTVSGDIDATGFVNQDDVNFLATFQGQESNGPFDARDFNGDGLINKLDIEQLANLCEGIACEIPTDPSPEPEIIPGDLDGDGNIDMADFMAFQATFGRCEGQPNYNPKANFDEDTCITFVDYQTWYGLFTSQQ